MRSVRGFLTGLPHLSRRISSGFPVQTPSTAGRRDRACARTTTNGLKPLRRHIHRDAVRDLLVAGIGVGRILERDTHHDARFAAGALVPALRDWTSPEVPPVTLLHPPSVRRIARVRLFIEWVTQLFADLEHQRHAPAPATGVPCWIKSQRQRTSAAP